MNFGLRFFFFWSLRSKTALMNPPLVCVKLFFFRCNSPDASVKKKKPPMRPVHYTATTTKGEKKKKKKK